MTETRPQSDSRRRTLILAATICASAMAFIDGTVINVALPSIQHGLDASLPDLQWVSNGYLLMLGSLILVGGALGDRIGRRRVFIAGIAIFALASVFCAIAPSIRLLIAFRVLQGIGAALLIPQSLAIISATFPKAERGRAIGTWAAASSVTTAIGPPLGGFLVDALSWRFAFWINLPLAALALWLTWSAVPENRDDKARGAIDWAGAFIAIVSTGALTLGLISVSEADPNVAVSIVIALAGLLGVAGFVLFELRAANPIMPPDLFRSRVFAGTNIVTLLLYGALAAILFLLPFDLQARRGLDASETALTLLPIGVLIAGLSRFTGGWSDRTGPRAFLTVGSALVGLCAVGLALTIDDYVAGVLVPILLLGVGMGILVSPLTTAVMNSVPDERSGAASGINNAASRLAGVLAIAILGAVAGLVFAALAPADARFGILPAAGAPEHAAVEGAFLSAYRAAIALAALWCFAAAAVAWISLRGAEGTQKSRT